MSPVLSLARRIDMPGMLIALVLGTALGLVALPARVGLARLQGESAEVSLRVAAALMPTLIFPLVLAHILRERHLYGRS